MSRHTTLLALMLASGAMAHHPEMFLGRDIGKAWPAHPKASTGNRPSTSRHDQERADAAEAKRARREERNRRNAARSAQ